MSCGRVHVSLFKLLFHSGCLKHHSPQMISTQKRSQRGTGTGKIGPEFPCPPPAPLDVPACTACAPVPAQDSGGRAGDGDPAAATFYGNKKTKVSSTRQNGAAAVQLPARPSSPTNYNGYFCFVLEGFLWCIGFWRVFLRG